MNYVFVNFICMHANKVDEYIVHKQVCVQLPTSADNVTLLVFAAKCSAAVRRAAAAVDRWNVRTDRETDKRADTVPIQRPRAYISSSVNNTTCLKGWLGSRVVSVLDSDAEGPGFNLNRSRDAVG